MTIEQAIHEAWAGDAGLTALVPAVRVFTGCAPPETSRPIVVVERRAARPALRTSSGTVERIELALLVYENDYDRGAAIAAAVASRFDGAALDSDEGRVVALRRGEETRRVGGPERMEFALVYELDVYRNL